MEKSHCFPKTKPRINIPIEKTKDNKNFIVSKIIFLFLIIKNTSNVLYHLNSRFTTIRKHEKYLQNKRK